jgi:hypothetical protein
MWIPDGLEDSDVQSLNDEDVNYLMYSLTKKVVT